MTPRYRRILLLCGLLPTLAAAVLSLTRPAALANLEYAVYDRLVRWTPTRQPSGKIVIVDVDEKSLTSIGQWPWRRDVISRLIDSLRDRGAAVVALDIMFPESDRYDGTGRSPDAVLSDTLRKGRAILGYGLLFDPTGEAPKPCVQHALSLPIIRGAGVQTEDPFFQATSAVCNIPTLTSAAQASGFLNAAPDPDGILRRAPLLMQYRGRVYPALSLAAVRSVSNARQPGAAHRERQHRRTRSRRTGGAARREEQPVAAVPRREAIVPVRVSGRCPQRAGRSRRVQGSHRVRRDDGAWYARGCGHTARYAVRRRRGAGDRC